MKGIPVRPAGRLDVARFAWQPRADVYEEGDSLVVSIELPGVAAEDLEVRFEQGRLIVLGSRGRPRALRKWQRSEQAMGAFGRAIEIPAAFAGGEIEAWLDLGVLRVTFRAVRRAPIPIQIRAAEEPEATDESDPTRRDLTPPARDE